MNNRLSTYTTIARTLSKTQVALNKTIDEYLKVMGNRETNLVILLKTDLMNSAIRANMLVEIMDKETEK